MLARSASETTRWCGRGEQRRRIAAALADREEGSARITANTNSVMVLLPAEGTREVVKISTTKGWPVVQAEYASLEELARLPRTGRWSVPEPRGCSPDVNGYAMTYHGGLRLDRLVASAPTETSGEAHEAMTEAGRALGEIHRAWVAPACAAAERALADDLRRLARWRTLAPDVLARIRDCVGSGTFARSYWDFDPVNIVRTGDGVVLLDPPEIAVSGSVAWDIGVFLAGVRRAGWRTRSLRYGWARAAYEDAFLEGYESAGERVTPGDRLLAEVACLLRLAQLYGWWTRVARPRLTPRNVARGAWAATVLPFAIRAQLGIVSRQAEWDAP